MGALVLRHLFGVPGSATVAPVACLSHPASDHRHADKAYLSNPWGPKAGAG